MAAGRPCTRTSRSRPDALTSVPITPRTAGRSTAMRPVLPIAGAVIALMGWSLAAQVASAPAPAGSAPSLRSIGLVIYPANGQSPQRQAADEAECVAWAEAQTGVKLSPGSVDTEAAARAARDATA